MTPPTLAATAAPASAAPPRRRAAPRGFTMVELIVVMVVLGLLGAIGVMRFFNRGAFDADAFTSQTKAMLRYAQKVAIAQNRPVFVRLDGASVALCFNFQSDATCAAGNRLFPAAGTNSGAAATLAACAGAAHWACEAPPAGVNYTLNPAAAYAGANNYFYFSALGKPYAAADPVGTLASGFAPLTITIGGDGLNRPVTVEADTGYVH